MNRNGFTMVEVITVLVLLGILSATAMMAMRNMGETEFAERLLLKSNLRYARQRAMDSTNNWSIAFSGGSYTLQEDGSASGSFPSVGSGSYSSGLSLSSPSEIEFEAQKGSLTVSGMQTIRFPSGSTIEVYPTGAIP